MNGWSIAAAISSGACWTSKRPKIAGASTGEDTMKFFKPAIAAFAAMFMFAGAAYADGVIRIQSLDDATAQLSEDKRPPKCIFTWGKGFPAPDASGPGSVKVATAANRYSPQMVKLAREDGVLPSVMITDEHDGKTVTFELRQVRVQKVRNLSGGARGANPSADVLQQEWSLTYETIQRVS